MKKIFLIFLIFSLTFTAFSSEKKDIQQNRIEKENATIYHGKILNPESQDFQVIAFHIEKCEDKSIKVLFRMTSPIDPESIKNSELFINEKKVSGPFRFSKDGCKMSFLISGVKFKKEKDFSIKLKNIKSYSGEKMKDFSVSGINFSEKYRFDKRNRQWQKF